MSFVAVVIKLPVLANRRVIKILFKSKMRESLGIKRIVFDVGVGKHPPDFIVINQIVAFVTTNVCVSERILSQVYWPLGIYGTRNSDDKDCGAFEIFFRYILIHSQADIDFALVMNIIPVLLLVFRHLFCCQMIRSELVVLLLDAEDNDAPAVLPKAEYVSQKLPGKPPSALLNSTSVFSPLSQRLRIYEYNSIIKANL